MKVSTCSDKPSRVCSNRYNIQGAENSKRVKLSNVLSGRHSTSIHSEHSHQINISCSSDHESMYFSSHLSPMKSLHHSKCNMSKILIFTLHFLYLIALCTSLPHDTGLKDTYVKSSLSPPEIYNPSIEQSNSYHHQGHHLHHLRHLRNTHTTHVDASANSDENLDAAVSSSSPSSSLISPEHRDTVSSDTAVAAATVDEMSSYENVKAHDQSRTRTHNFRLNRISRSGPSLETQPSGDDHKVQAGQPFVISCMASGANPGLFSELTWYDPKGQEIVSSPDFSVTLSNAGHKKMLVFKKPKLEDEGVYTCKSVFQDSVKLEKSVRFVIYEGIQWKDCPEYQALVKGRSGEMIKCTAQARPKADLTWIKNDNNIDSERYSTETSGIKIRGITNESDAGKYSILATVTETGAVETRDITVEVHIKPNIEKIIPSSPANITEGESATFTCTAKAFPYATFSWIGPMQRNLSTAPGYVVDKHSGILTIQQVNKRDDHGSFRCIASNAAGSDEKSVSVTVFTRPVVERFEMTSTAEGNEGHIKCIATGTPSPKISIKKEGQDDRKLYSGQRRIQLDTITQRDEVILTGKIINVEKSDSGVYYCVAENEAAIAQKSTYLEVKYKPDLSETVRTVKSWNGHTINLTCIANSIPNATVNWLKPNRQIISNADRLYQVYKSPARADLTVKCIDQSVYGNYQCQASNEIGTSDVFVSLSEAFVPSAIPLVKVMKKTTQSILFDINPPVNDGGLPVRQYHVKYGIAGTYESKIFTWPATSSDNAVTDGYYLEKLEPEKRYYFKFAAQNDVGKGPEGADILVDLPKESQPEPVVLLIDDPKNDPLKGEVISQFNREFTLRWNEPSDNGRAIESYEIKFSKVKRSTESESEWQNEGTTLATSVPATDALTYTLKNLQPNSYYKVEITAKNALGFSSPSKLIFKTADIHDATDQLRESGVNGSNCKSPSLVILLLVTLITVTSFYHSHH